MSDINIFPNLNSQMNAEKVKESLITLFRVGMIRITPNGDYVVNPISNMYESITKDTVRNLHKEPKILATDYVKSFFYELYNHSNDRAHHHTHNSNCIIYRGNSIRNKEGLKDINQWYKNVLDKLVRFNSQNLFPDPSFEDIKNKKNFVRFANIIENMLTEEATDLLSQPNKNLIALVQDEKIFKPGDIIHYRTGQDSLINFTGYKYLGIRDDKCVILGELCIDSGPSEFINDMDSDKRYEYRPYEIEVDPIELVRKNPLHRFFNSL